eukprot:3778547-Rhodomonas_salina.2
MKAEVDSADMVLRVPLAGYPGTNELRLDHTQTSLSQRVRQTPIPPWASRYAYPGTGCWVAGYPGTTTTRGTQDRIQRKFFLMILIGNSLRMHRIPGAESHKLKLEERVAPCFVGKNYSETCLEPILILRMLQRGIARLASIPKQVSPSRMLLGHREIGDGAQSALPERSMLPDPCLEGRCPPRGESCDEGGCNLKALHCPSRKGISRGPSIVVFFWW